MNDIDLFDAAPSVRSPNLGGAREGAGRKTKAHEDQVKAALEAEGEIEYSVARARKEAWTAKTVELDYRIKQNEYVRRDEVRQVCATAFSSLAQSLRSIPDLLERRDGIAPEVAERVGNVIDEVLDSLANEFEMLGGEDE
ncbi:MAG: DUF1441 family protein [Microbacteriaceae bacterium]